MSIPKNVLNEILREYEEKRTKAVLLSREKVSAIEQEIPEISHINREISSLSISTAISRLSNGGSISESGEKIRSLASRKEILLKMHGYKKDDLLPKYECSLCGDTGFLENGQNCPCLNARISDYLYNQSGIKSILEKENFSAFSFKYYSDEPLNEGSTETPLSVAQKAFESARSFIHGFSGSTESLLIMGEAGVGKTFLSNCIAKEIIDEGFLVLYFSSARLFNALADLTFSSEHQKSFSGPATPYTADLLIIDDLGTEFMNNFVQSSLFTLLNERLLNGKHTIISTNLSMQELKDNYTERIFSRIANNYKIIKLFGDDIRIKKKLEDKNA